MKTQEVVNRLNELATRLPRITTTLALQRIPIDLSELQSVTGYDKYGQLNSEGGLNVTFHLGCGAGSATMNFVDLINALCDDGSISYKIDGEGRIRFEVGPNWYPYPTTAR